ncbi:MAG: porphobilinogen synthase [Parachlamydiales bacterium]
MLRYRQTPQLRKLLAETKLNKSDFIFPLFVHESSREKKLIKKMPGVYQHSLASLLPEVERVAKLGVESVILFGIPSEKDEQGSKAYASDGVVQKSIAMIKKNFPEIVLIADCCLCEYTSNGHCGIMCEGHLDNDKTLESLQKVAISYAEKGVDIVAPSGMMDGMVQAIRQALDQARYPMIPIMSYAAKFASQFYGPFREASSDDIFIGDRKHHQIQPSQKREALREALLDIDESADYLIVKPGLPYLDIIQTLRQETLLPIVAYQVSGEYSTLKYAADNGLIDEQEAFKETLICLKRAGADLIITYYADRIVSLI